MSQADNLHDNIAELLASIGSTPEPKNEEKPEKRLEIPTINDISSIVHDNNVTDSFAMIVQDELKMITTDVKLLEFKYWEALAYDMALDHTPVQELVREYNISEQELELLLKNEYFVKILNAKREEVEKAGDNASIVTQFRMVTQLGLEEFTRRITSPYTKDRDFATLFRLSLEMGRLLPTKQEGAIIDMSGSDGVTLNVFSIPGLEHITKPKKDERQIIDVEDV